MEKVCYVLTSAEKDHLSETRNFLIARGCNFSQAASILNIPASSFNLIKCSINALKKSDKFSDNIKKLVSQNPWPGVTDIVPLSDGTYMMIATLELEN
jgi:hypothetical protein